MKKHTKKKRKRGKKKWVINRWMNQNEYSECGHCKWRVFYTSRKFYAIPKGYSKLYSDDRLIFFFEIKWNVTKRNVTKRRKSYYSLSLPDFELLFPLIVSIVLLTISLWEALDKLLNIYGILYAINGVTYTLYNRKYIKHKLDKRCK